MSTRLMLCHFDNEKGIMAATRAARERGYDIVDVFSPYAVHGLEKAMGLKPSRLPWVALIFGMFGALFMLWFQYWSSATDWPLNVGGMPWNSLPAFFPVVFETGVLLAGLSIVAALFISCRLYPGKKACMPSLDVTNHIFVLVINVGNAAVTVQEIESLGQEFGADRVVEQCEIKDSCSA